jgi:hypothetical protein
MLALGVILGAVGHANARDVSIPPSLQAAIKTVQPQARIITRADIDWQSCGLPEADQIVNTDLNGDGFADYATLLFVPTSGSRTTGALWLVVFLGRRDGSYKAVVLDRHKTVVLDRHGDRPSTGLLGITIRLQAPGVVEEVPSGRHISLTLPAVQRVWCERSSTIFFWSNKARRFQSVWTGD